MSEPRSFIESTVDSILTRADHKCEICGSINRVQAAHICTRANYKGARRAGDLIKYKDDKYVLSPP
jgi:hypothetical protein